MTGPRSPLQARVGPYRLPTGQAVSLEVRRDLNPRGLDSAGIRARLGPAPMPMIPPTLIQIITDLSGSMWGGNDANGLRHEAALIVAEHLASKATQRVVPWALEVISFDTTSTFDIPATPVDRRAARALAPVLLAKESGGSSNLGPALSKAEGTNWPGPRALCVLSDFELFDSDVPSTLGAFAGSAADVVMALVFRSSPPPQLRGTSVLVRKVDPATDAADVVATYLWEAVCWLSEPGGVTRPR